MEEAEEVIPIIDRSKETLGLGAYRTKNRTTVINITKYKETESFVCKFCSVTLKSLNKLEKHKEQMHGHGKDKLFYCSECGISKDSPKLA